jgi:hypothetical protein
LRLEVTRRWRQLRWALSALLLDYFESAHRWRAAAREQPMSISKEDAAKELAEVLKKIEAHYWRFTRSARPGAWRGDLYRRRAELEELVYGHIIS